MTDKKPGTPLAAAHLRPETRQKAGIVAEETFSLPEPGLIMPIPDRDGDNFTALLNGLFKLREPFADDQIEKLPKPIWKGAWDGIKGSQCSVCHGYHVLQNTIHLDYVGHASATNRLLDADPWWNWEPMAYTEAGTPLFSDGGLWIKLTVCGVTRIGYGDGKGVKEVIGDAIRNAAMRFGVALDLWSKINLHEGINQGDGQTQASRSENDRRGQQRSGDSRVRSSAPAQEVSDTPPAENQDALDSLASICDEHGFGRGTMRERFFYWAQAEGLECTELTDAPSDSIGEFAIHLVTLANAGPVAPGGDEGEGQAAGGTDGDSDATESGAADVPGTADTAGSDGSGEEGSDSAVDPGNMF